MLIHFKMYFYFLLQLEVWSVYFRVIDLISFFGIIHCLSKILLGIILPIENTLISNRLKSWEILSIGLWQYESTTHNGICTGSPDNAGLASNWSITQNALAKHKMFYIMPIKLVTTTTTIVVSSLTITTTIFITTDTHTYKLYFNSNFSVALQCS